MKCIKPILATALLLCSTSTWADKAAEQAAAQLLESMNMEVALQQGIEQTLDIQLQQNPNLQPFKATMLQFLNKYMSYDSLKPELIQIYAATFTATELQQINAFYATPIGQKVISKMPQLMAQGGQLGAKRVQDNIAELQQMLQAEAQRLQQQQSNSPAQ